MGVGGFEGFMVANPQVNVFKAHLRVRKNICKNW
jgi:hypothetical protein